AEAGWSRFNRLFFWRHSAACHHSGGARLPNPLCPTNSRSGQYHDGGRRPDYISSSSRTDHCDRGGGCNLDGSPISARPLLAIARRPRTPAINFLARAISASSSARHPGTGPGQSRETEVVLRGTARDSRHLSVMSAAEPRVQLSGHSWEMAALKGLDRE